MTCSLTMHLLDAPPTSWEHVRDAAPLTHLALDVVAC
jgi:hypothetical protein